MNTQRKSYKQAFMEKIYAKLDKHLPKKHTALFQEFADQYFAILGKGDLCEGNIDDFFGSVLSMWRFCELLKPNTKYIEIFNPSYEEHGWHSNHTILRLLADDMPFIVDSTRLHLTKKNLTIHCVQNMILHCWRDEEGRRVYDVKRKKKQCKNAALHIEIDRIEKQEEIDLLKAEITAIIADVTRIVTDFIPICDKLKEISAQIKENEKYPDKNEVLTFLEWLLRCNFTFLGFEEITIKKAGKKFFTKRLAASCLGLLNADKEGYISQETLEPALYSDAYKSQDSIIFSKAAIRSSVHRNVYPDFIAIKNFDDKGVLIGEFRILGLYTSPVYTESPRKIPWISRKVSAVLEKSGFEPSSHLGKELIQIIEVFPRDELFQMPQEQLIETLMSVLQIQERHQVRVFLRQGPYDLFVSAIVYVPRDIYSTSLRVRLQAILEESLDTSDAYFTTYFSESVLARVYFNFKLKQGTKVEVDHDQLTKRLIEAASTWQQHLCDAVLEAKGEAQGNRLLSIYAKGFSPGYQDMFTPRTAVIDIDYCEQLTELKPLGLNFYRGIDDDASHLRFKVYHLGCPLPLAEQIPIFDNLGLKVIGEYPYTIKKSNSECVWIHDFSMAMSSGFNDVDIHKVSGIFRQAFRNIWYEEAENDLFNLLVLGANLTWRQVALLRAYARYMKQIRFGFSQSYIATTLGENIDIAKQLSELFTIRFDPNFTEDEAHRESVQKKLFDAIYNALDNVALLSHDQILRQYLHLIMATMRTNFYQLDDKERNKPYISFKLLCAEIPNLPKPCPLYEIFVYSPKVEGIHLRMGKVARGGLRWSDRVEDFRTEVLGLVKAQQVKNAVIVPVGAKGGFVTKNTPASLDQKSRYRDGLSAYKTFISGLLDLTDNLDQAQLIRPAGVICHDDDDDPYLVVAADKGTANFSDIANDIAKSYSFWLGDAFASGGSAGYDHKKMGITARGAWVSVERHFRECGINIHKESISAIGIGDMAGDVFGNALLISHNIKLLGAFNHMHIFIDPNPEDNRASYTERKRLFEMAGSTWGDYDSKLISIGGGVFSRNLKRIPISPQMKARFQITEDWLSPNQLIKRLLKAEVDLIWNGGIGTYVKASSETHAEVGDKSNDAVRIDGCELNCKVFGEGGNLGITQSGRIEYASGGGRINTDFIDNSAGVDCSDHEVNIKILCNNLIALDDMTQKQRDLLLEDMTDDVAALVLNNNYEQTQALSIASAHVVDGIDLLRRYMAHLEAQGKLDRAIEYLPTDEEILERSLGNEGLTRPELCTLMSYAKNDTQERLLGSLTFDDAYLTQELLSAFPKRIGAEFQKQALAHKLRKEIIATQLASRMINIMGIAFAYNLEQSIGASYADIATVFVIARDIFNIDHYWRRIQALDFEVNTNIQYQLMDELIRLIRRSCRWFLRRKKGKLNPSFCVGSYGPIARRFAIDLESFMSESVKNKWKQKVEEISSYDVPKDLAEYIAASKLMFYSLPIREVVVETGQSLDQVASAFFVIGEYLDLHWFAQELANLTVRNHWQAVARDSVRDDVIWQQRQLTISLLSCPGENINERLLVWQGSKKQQIERWSALLDEIRSSSDGGIAMYIVASYELAALV